MEGKVLSEAIYVRVSTKEQAAVIQNVLGFSRFFLSNPFQLDRVAVS